ncbi:hypothetical protein [Tropicimonas sp. S265A]|uniref:hypothetical protein n=1 Tax=Tropicimonas sp. S265A TaxID=3415134 RepID=UPI003C7A2C86
MKKPRSRVTDHTLVKYVELVEGLSLDEMRAHIAKLVETGVEEKATGVRVGKFIYRLSGNRVVDIYPASLPNKRTGCVKHPKVDRDA